MSSRTHKPQKHTDKKTRTNETKNKKKHARLESSRASFFFLPPILSTRTYAHHTFHHTGHENAYLYTGASTLYFVKRKTTERERSDAHDPSVTASTSPSEHSSANGFLRLASVCFLRAGGLGMYNTSPGRVSDGCFRPLCERCACGAIWTQHRRQCNEASGGGNVEPARPSGAATAKMGGSRVAAAKRATGGAWGSERYILDRRCRQALLRCKPLCLSWEHIGAGFNCYTSVGTRFRCQNPRAGRRPQTPLPYNTLALLTTRATSQNENDLPKRTRNLDRKPDHGASQSRRQVREKREALIPKKSTTASRQHQEKSGPAAVSPRPARVKSE